jgi:hypothetical protein
MEFRFKAYANAALHGVRIYCGMNWQMPKEGWLASAGDHSEHAIGRWALRFTVNSELEVTGGGVEKVYES